MISAPAARRRAAACDGEHRVCVLRLALATVEAGTLGRTVELEAAAGRPPRPGAPFVASRAGNRSRTNHACAQRRPRPRGGRRTARDRPSATGRPRSRSRRARTTPSTSFRSDAATRTAARRCRGRAWWWSPHGGALQRGRAPRRRLPWSGGDGVSISSARAAAQSARQAAARRPGGRGGRRDCDVRALDCSSPESPLARRSGSISTADARPRARHPCRERASPCPAHSPHSRDATPRGAPGETRATPAG